MHGGYPGRVLFYSTRVLQNSTQPPKNGILKLHKQNVMLGGSFWQLPSHARAANNIFKSFAIGPDRMM
jgi:hypothetical protein